MDCCQRGIAVNAVKIGIQTRKLAIKHQIYEFKAGSSWVNRFMKKNSLSVRATTMRQKLLHEIIDFVNKKYC
uniref:HTH CENPB-type domain-containing protein n=1 Tax=Strongyloides venezuelensis TaxID=75913 RepID=A0A0K0EZL3_STRVS